ncbi:MAG TPA: hypothetical protein VFM58_09675 [Solirubrobacteraceae bacterium]|nr:hypothetical protein [Solirubrobacteraceae bacterium]
MRRSLSHPLAPTLVSALLGMAYLIAAPMTADMAAHTFRTWLWSEMGFATWNAQWYGGHHMAGYSLLYPPLAALAGTRVVGVIATVAAVWAFSLIAARIAPTRGAAALATWLFAGGVVSNLLVGRMPFALGIAFAVGAWACLPRSRIGAALLALGSAWASPVAGVYVCVGAVAAFVGARPGRDGRDDRRAAVLVGAPALLGGLAMAALFPEGGTDRFVATAFWPMLLVSLAALALVDPARRIALWAAALNAVVLIGAFAIPNALGQNALRPALLVGASLLVLAARPGVPRAAIALVAAALVYLTWLPAVRAVSEARGDPSTQAGFYDEVLGFLDRRARPGERVEVPLTHNHWEANFVARRYPIARGWHRQLDRRTNPLFYDEGPLTPARYARWLRANAVRWIALPHAPLDFSAEAERAVLLAGQPFLREVHRSGDWTIWEVRDPEPPVSGSAHLTAAGADGFDIAATAPGSLLVRQRWTPYWTVVGGAGCVSEDGSSDWTRVDVRRAGVVRVRARFSAAGALRREPRCADVRVDDADAVGPPIASR